MVVYFKKRPEAKRIHRRRTFVAGGEFDTTRVLERRDRVKQCYNCQQITNRNVSVRATSSLRQVYTRRLPSLQMHGNDPEDVSHAAALMSHTAEPIRSSIQHRMNNMFRLLQPNVRKQGPAHESLINHKDIRDAAVLAIQEPQARQIQGKQLTVPMGHHG
ncbi:hypothetical protein FOMA001_g17581 [Fusarium oxysporum f. sp. matthiolae]|nr:hypothetical protein FOMA001_g17581 [Fusarium oxysporum f. sp. matthiolae]